MGDLKYGDIMVSECFDSEGGLVWWYFNEFYVSYEFDYFFGDEVICVFDDSVLMV